MGRFVQCSGTGNDSCQNDVYFVVSDEVVLSSCPADAGQCYFKILLGGLYVKSRRMTTIYIVSSPCYQFSRCLFLIYVLHCFDVFFPPPVCCCSLYM